MSVVDLAAMKTALTLTGATYDAALQVVIDEAESIISDSDVGPLAPTSKTAVLDCIDFPAFTLPVGPLISIQSITTSPYPSRQSLDLTYLTIDSHNDIAYVGYRAPWMTGYGPYTVTYTAGWQQIPPGLVKGIKELVRHLWSTQRGAGKRPGSAPSEEVGSGVPGAAYLFPIRVEQALRPYRRPGVA